MSLDYTTYVSRLAAYGPYATSTDAGFQAALPAIIEYGEQRCYRELDLLHTQITDASGQASSGNRSVTLSTAQGTFITVDQVNVITPAGTVSSAGSRVPLMAVSPEYIDLVYPSNTMRSGQPKFFGRRSDDVIILGPPPAQTYYLEVIGIQRPLELSSGNSSTVLTQYVPDLFFAASMIQLSAFMRDFGSQADNPQNAQSWEQQYQTLFRSAEVEQARAKFQSEGWTSEQPSKVATPPRV